MKLFYITNDLDVAVIAQDAGVDRIFIDLEQIGKAIRQKGMNTVQSQHCIEDIIDIKKVLYKSELLVRCNPIHQEIEIEIDHIVEAGADIIMLPYFKSVGEVERFLQAVNGRCRTILLFETPEAVTLVDEILDLHGIDEVFIGLNDLSLGYGKRFMFELLADGTVEQLCLKFQKRNLPYGFGGIAAVGTGTLPAEAILKEHYRLGSSMVILARAFCDYAKINNLDIVKEKFTTGVKIMRLLENEIEMHSNYFRDNQTFVRRCVEKIVG